MSDHLVLILLATTTVTIAAVLAAGAAGYLARIDGASYLTAIARASATFAAVLNLAALLITALTPLLR
ncbi:hypothetical protein [Kitasatospora sp. NRRL B-11411]|uniref:hypothetical protein n=1 Tax=Kitasatospora sp. NRRL B-11411 TaxID=1463822 RepID=UPI0004C46F71|nr:hypothetical protein [Kitasatospora sp. NRRL B-11411]